MNLSGFKKLKEDKKTVTMAHAAGHQITIFKDKLPALQKKQLEKLPLHLADGDPDVEAPSSDPVANNTSSFANAANQFAAGLPDLSRLYKGDDPNASFSGALNNAAADASDQATEEMAKVAPPENIEAQSPPSVPSATSSAGSEVGPKSANAAVPSSIAGSSANPIDLNKSYQQGQKAISEQQDVASQLAKKKADIEQGQLDARAGLQKAADDNLAGFQKHKDDFANYIQNNPIDPKHYVENMGTVQKVSTAIGLLLGGFTGGFNHTGVNPAADWLNQQITRDIEGQKSRMDQQKTILGANQELYHDQVLANNAARINMNDLYDHKIQQAADQLGTPAAKAAADAQHSKFAIENHDLLQKNAIRTTALQGLQKGGAGLDPISLANAGLMNPEEGTKEQAAFETHKAGVQRINDLYAAANKEQTSGNVVNPQSYKAIDSINSQLLNTFMSLDGTKRYSPELAKALLSPNLIKTTDDTRVRALKQNNVLEQAQSLAAGSMPNFSRLAPGALPKYSIPNEHKPGDIVYVGDRKGQVQANGDIKAVK